MKEETKMDKGLHIVVCVKIVPKPEDVKLKEDNTLDRANAESVINPPDKNAVETAVSLKERYGGKVTAISMGPPFFDDFMRLVMAMGVDNAILLSDRAFAGADTYPTTLTIAAGIKKLGDVDLVICGEESSDGGTGNVPPGIAEWLGWTQATYCHEIDYDEIQSRFVVKRSISTGYEVISIPKPAVVSVELGINSPRFPNFYLKQEYDQNYKVTIWDAKALNLDPERVGLKGSHTTVDSLKSSKGRERQKQFIKGDPKEIAEKLAAIILENM